jgi:hypothetical protein
MWFLWIIAGRCFAARKAAELTSLRCRLAAYLRVIMTREIAGEIQQASAAGKSSTMRPGKRRPRKIGPLQLQDRQ